MKLLVELIPKKCWNSNVRSTLKTKQWNIIRFMSYEKAGNQCEICHQTGIEQGFKHNVECHEIWEYDDKKRIQKLTGLISLCVLCHMTKHIGRASAMGKQGKCFEHMQLVNKWTHKQVVNHLAEAYELQKKRSEYTYTLDLSLLTKEPYNFEINSDKRIFNKPKYKRKRAKKK